MTMDSSAALEPQPKSVRNALKTAYAKALEIQHPLAVAYVARRRKVSPDTSPPSLLSYSKKFYLGTVTASGAGAGASAAVPNGLVQVPVAIADFATFLEASVFYVLAATEIHGLDVDDLERRRLLVTTALLGDSAMKATVRPLTSRTAPYLGKQIVKAIPREAITAANKVLGPRFITKYGTKQGLLVLGKQIPAFIGAGIGGGGNALFAAMVARTTSKLLGPPPANWPAPIQGPTTT